MRLNGSGPSAPVRRRRTTPAAPATPPDVRLAAIVAARAIGEAGREPLEARAHMTAFGIVVGREERLALLAGGAGFERPRFAQSLVRELAARAAGRLAQDLSGGLPESAGLFGFARFGEKATDGVEHQFKLRRAEASNRDVARRRSTETSRNVVPDGAA